MWFYFISGSGVHKAVIEISEATQEQRSNNFFEIWEGSRSKQKLTVFWLYLRLREPDKILICQKSWSETASDFTQENGFCWCKEDSSQKEVSFMQLSVSLRYLILKPLANLNQIW